MEGFDGEDYMGEATDGGSAHDYYEPQGDDVGYETYDAQGLDERIETAVQQGLAPIYQQAEDMRRAGEAEQLVSMHPELAHHEHAHGLVRAARIAAHELG